MTGDAPHFRGIVMLLAILMLIGLAFVGCQGMGGVPSFE